MVRARWARPNENSVGNKTAGQAICSRHVFAPSAEEFERIALPHAGAALALARALLGSESDADDVVQEAYVRAFKYFSSYQGGEGRAWFLAIVRNAAYAHLQKNGRYAPLDDSEPDSRPDPETLVLRAADASALKHAMAQLPAEFREVLTLRELEELSYKEIADVAAIPLGTVMSRLSRARALLTLKLGGTK